MSKKFKISQMDAKTLSWWYSKRDQIDVDPPYQRRGKIWSDTDKAYLIDSIINGFDIPKLYLADFTWGNSQLNRKKLSYAIIDGKQRLEAIFDFFDGYLTLNDDFVFSEMPSLKLGGLSYKDIKDNYKDIADQFENFNLLVMAVMAKNEDPINELFVRLNRSQSLTGAEIRNAMTGPAPEIIRRISKSDFFTTNINFQVLRGQDLNAAAKILLFEFYDGFKETTKPYLDNFVREMKKKPDSQKLELAARRVIDVLDIMSSIFLPKDKLLTSAGILPVYYYLVKAIPEKYYRFVREFLLKFEDDRRINRELVRNEPNNKNIKISIVNYDQFNRSTNSQQSHEGRFKILKKEFDAFSSKFFSK